MDLILWRHAEAESGSPDLARALTRNGEQQAAMMADWLRRYVPPGVKILASPARRTQQTAQALGLPYETRDELAPGKSPETVLTVAGWPDGRQAVMIVGHNPTLCQIASLILTNNAAD